MTSTYYSQNTLSITANAIATGLSIIGSLWMCYWCLKSSPRKSVTPKLILGIALSDFFYAVSNVMTPFDEDFSGVQFCVVEGFLRQTGRMLTASFAACTAALCYKSSLITQPFDQERFYKTAYLICISLSLVLSLPPLFVPSVNYRRNPLYCWVQYNPEPSSALSASLMERVVVSIYDIINFLIPVIVSIFWYTKAILNYKELSRNSSTDMSYVYRLLWYPATLFLAFLPVLIDECILNFDTPEWFIAIHLLVAHSIGFINAVVYGVQAKSWANYHLKSQDISEKPDTPERSMYKSASELLVTNLNISI